MNEAGVKQGARIHLSVPEEFEILKCIRETVRDGVFGVDYTIANRDKNRRLRKDYNIDDAKIKRILMDLQVDNFVKAAKSDNLAHPEDIVYIFKKTTILMPRWRENADYEPVILYIKITWPENNGGMFIISFHEDNI